jgi:flagellar biosynthesis protein FliQ
MDPQQVLTIGRDGLFTLLTVCTPLLGVVLAVGLLVSIFQAATQIHEQTLSFVPKLLAAFATLAVAGPWMLTTLVDYMRQVLQSIPSVVN